MSVSVSFIAFRLTCGRPERQRCASDCRATIYLLRYTPIHFDRQTCERRSLFPASLRRRAMSRPESGHMRGGPELPRICQDPLDRLTFSFPRSPQPPIVLVHCSSFCARTLGRIQIASSSSPSTDTLSVAAAPQQRSICSHLLPSAA